MTNPSHVLSAGELARIEEIWGDPADWVAEGYGWTSLDAVHRMINRRVTGDPGKRPLDWFFAGIAAERPLPLDRGLVLACGGGEFERDVMRHGYVREIVAIDVSERVLKVAGEAAAREGMRGITYLRGDMNDLQVDGPFDIVFGAGAIHHCQALEALFAAVERLLKPDGWVYLDDYVGPSRFQWTDRQLAHTNKILALLPERFVRTLSGRVKRRFERLPVAEVIAYDPSEAVRSAEITEQLAARFEVVARRGYGGALLHLVLGHVAQNFRSGDGPIYLDRLIEAEDRLMRTGSLPDDFIVMTARKRGRS